MRCAATGDNRRVDGEHYFTSEPSTRLVPRTVEFSVAGYTFSLNAATGVFSAHRLDPGTAVLLRKADLPSAGEPGPLLDLGCGYGPIACVLARVAGSATVYAVDVNARALDLAAHNASALGLGNIKTLRAEEVPDGVRFRQIWSNPPIHVGKPALHDLLLNWLPRLADDGVAWLVVARNLGADSLQLWLSEQGYSVQRRASQKGFRILRVTGTRPP